MDEELTDALAVVSRACASVQGDLPTHQTIQGALQKVTEALQPPVLAVVSDAPPD